MMKNLTLFCLIIFQSIMSFGQDDKKYYLKLAMGSKWNMVSGGELLTTKGIFKKTFGDKPLKTVYGEALLGIPLAYFAHIETGFIINSYRYQEYLSNRYGISTFKIQLTDVTFTNLQIPLRLRTSINLVNKRLYFLSFTGISDLLAVFNEAKESNFEQEYTFYNTGQVPVKRAELYNQEETINISNRHLIYTHPLYFEIGAGLECFFLKNLSISGMMSYSLSANGNPVYSSSTHTILASDNQASYDAENYFLQQNTLSTQVILSIQYYFKNNISSWLKPFESKK